MDAAKRWMRAGTPRARRRPRRRGASSARTAPKGSAGPTSSATSRPTTSCRRKICVRIEQTADRILAEIGIEFRDDPAALDHWKRAGAEGRRRAGEIRAGHAARDPEDRAGRASPSTRAIRPTRSRSAARASCSRRPTARPSCMDLDKGRRYGTIEDFRNFVKLAQSSPWLHHSGGTICEPVDVPVNKRHLDMVYSHIKYSDRGFMGSVTAESRAEDSIDMARIVFGDDFVDQNCVILGNVNVNSPLVWDGTMTTRAARLCPRQPGGGDRAVHPRRRHGAGHQCRRDRPVARRDHGRLRADPARAARRAGDLRQLPVVDVAAVGLADLRHAGAGDRLDGGRPARAAARTCRCAAPAISRRRSCPTRRR